MFIPIYTKRNQLDFPYTLGNQLVFDGVNTNIKITRTSGFPFYNDNPQSKKTISMWVYPTNVSGTLFSEGNSSTSIQYHQLSYDTSTGKLSAVIRNNGASYILNGTTSGNYFSINTWHHIAYSINGTIVKIYIDGASRENFTLTTQASTYNQAYIGLFGTNTLSSYFSGKIYDVRIYNKVLAQLEINELINHEIIDSSSLKLLYSFTELSGNVANDGSSSGNSGVITSGSFIQGSTINPDSRNIVVGRNLVVGRELI